MFHVTLQLFFLREKVYFPILAFEFGLVCILLWQRECGRNASVPVLGLHLKVCVPLPTLLSLCHHYKKTCPGQASGE